MKTITRRDLMKLGVASGALLATGGVFPTNALAGSIKLEKGGKDFSPKTGAERKMIPSACWSCVTKRTGKDLFQGSCRNQPAL
jgi:hypothetical protein